MKNLIDVRSEHLEIVLQILQQHLPQHATVWVFGSRAKKATKKFSDLDLAIDAGKPLSMALIADLNNAFEESALPYKVDVVDWLTIDESFRSRIESGRVLVWEGKDKS